MTTAAAAKYAFALETWYAKLDAQEVGMRLEELSEKHKEHLTHEEILADARKASSPLHDAFEWDENKAAEGFRRRQAMILMRQLVTVKGSKETKTKAFVYVRHLEHGRKVFLSTRSALMRPEYKEQVLAQAVSAFNRWASRWGGDRRLVAVKKDIDKLRAKLERELMASL
jgi:hypothetical protein